MMNVVRVSILLVCAVLATATFAQSGPPKAAFNSHEVHPDGSITFRYRNAGAKQVTVGVDVYAKPFTMTLGDDGVWTATTPALTPEIYRYSFTVDGVTQMDPLNGNVQFNYAYLGNEVLVPGTPAMPWELSPIAHGRVDHRMFTTHVAKNLPLDQSAYTVYTPPGYDPARKGGYPVMYLLHGWSENERTWSDQARAPYILDSLIDSGKAVPMIVVMPLGYGDLHFVQDGWGVWQKPQQIAANTALFSQELLTEIMPAVETEYNVANGRENRAIGGLSMGGLEGLSIGLNNTKMFAWVVGMSSAVVGMDDKGDFSKFVPALATPEAVKASDLRLLWIACGTEDGLIVRNRSLIVWAKAKGLNPVAVETPGLHTWEVWRDNLVHVAPLLFRPRP
jgi:enterochelin esterase-like enzyme